MPAIKIKFHFLLHSFTLQNRKALRIFIEKMVKREGKRLSSLNFIFCSDTYLLEINKTYLKHNYFTDIITFDLGAGDDNVEGEIYISIDTVRKNAPLYASSFKSELHRVIFHGVLHLCGFNDKTAKDKKQMRIKEEEYLQKYFQSKR